MKSYKLPVEVTITNEDVDNLVDNALNWCSHWCDFLEVGKEPSDKTGYMSEVITRGGTLKFHIDEPFEDGGEQDFELTLDKFLKGLAEYGEYDWEQFDGPMSDAALQQALFGEVVYG